ncbi:MAG TPA: hypothetical protein VFJ19_08685 [Nocardioidaceae bacterium]|nr:hypothetical protein [Nocardioidaceae bacterium]
MALRPEIVRPPWKARSPKYDANTVVALRFCWAVLGAPTGKRLAPMMAELVPTLRRFEELEITDETTDALVAMSAATMDRRLAEDPMRSWPSRAAHTKPGRACSRTRSRSGPGAEWDDAVPGFVEIDLVGYEGRNAVGEHRYTSRSPTWPPVGPRTAACATRPANG